MKNKQILITLCICVIFFSLIKISNACESWEVVCGSVCCNPGDSCDYCGCNRPLDWCCAGCGCGCGCTPNCGCASSTCIGSTCSDGCGGTCSGTMVCCTSNGGSCSDGDDCCSGFCINGFCRADCSAYDETDSCSSDDNVYNSADGGICIGAVCDQDLVCYDDFNYQTECSSCSLNYGSDPNGDVCEDDVGPSYSSDGMCTTSGCSTSGIISVNSSDSNNFASGCTNHSGDMCDSSITSPWTFSQDGLCVYDTGSEICSTTGFVFYNDSVYLSDSKITSQDYSNSSENFNGKSCDFTFTNGDYSAEGMVNSSSECQPVGTLMVLDDEDDYFKGTCDSSPDSCGLITSDLDSPWTKQGVCCNNACVGESESDCCDRFDCSDGQLCVNYGCEDSSNITINNLGITGIEQINQEYTSSRNVLLNLFFSVNAIKCRYINHDDSTTFPDNSSTDWTLWESCIGQRVWLLNSGSGPKTVYYQVNYTTYLSTSNDSINYNFSGYGLDTTNPSNMSIYHNNYTNDFENITISWTDAIDPESSIFEIPLIYNISLFNESGILIANASTTSLKKDFTIPEELWQSHGTYYYAIVKVINSAGLTNSSRSDDLYIDTEGPNMVSLEGYFKNISQEASVIMSTHDEDSWIYSPQINLSWSASDTLSGIYGYSYALVKNKNTEIDNIVEGTLSNLENEKTKIYYNLDSGKYYFKIKPRDKAGNFGDYWLINFSVDNTPPSKPQILTKNRQGNNYTFTWSESGDPESDVINYMLILNTSSFDLNITIPTSPYRNYTFYNLSISGDYNITVGALNGAGRWSWSTQKKQTIDSTPPIVRAMPNKTVITNYPILKAWTDEQAVCYYNQSDSLIRFKYTNTTYHETKIGFLPDKVDVYTYEITCRDTNDNIAQPVLIDFTVETSVIPNKLITENNFAYDNLIKTITFELNSSDKMITGINTELIRLSLNGKQKEISVFDIGNGFYNLSFKAPEQGNYEMIIYYNNTLSTTTKILTVNNLLFFGTYNDSSLSKDSSSSKRISYIDDMTRLGLATDSQIDITDDSYVNKILLNSSHGNNVYIFNTNPSDNIQSREKYLKSQTFNKITMPSFGHEITESNILNYIIYSPEFNIRSNSTILNPGKYIYLMRLELNSGKKEVVMDD